MYLQHKRPRWRNWRHQAWKLRKRIKLRDDQFHYSIKRTMRRKRKDPGMSAAHTLNHRLVNDAADWVVCTDGVCGSNRIRVTVQLRLTEKPEGPAIKHLILEKAVWCNTASAEETSKSRCLHFLKLTGIELHFLLLLNCVGSVNKGLKKKLF